MLVSKFLLGGGAVILFVCVGYLLRDDNKSIGDTVARPASLPLERERPINSFELSLDDLKQLAGSEENSEERDLRLSLLISGWFKRTNDPYEIARWIESIDNPPGSAFGVLAFRWVAYSPEETIKWISSLENAVWRDEAIAKSMMYVRTLRERRLEYVVGLVELESDPRRNAAILKRIFVESYESEPDLAMDVIMSSDLDEGLKQELLSL